MAMHFCADARDLAAVCRETERRLAGRSGRIFWHPKSNARFGRRRPGPRKMGRRRPKDFLVDHRAASTRTPALRSASHSKLARGSTRSAGMTLRQGRIARGAGSAQSRAGESRDQQLCHRANSTRPREGCAIDCGSKTRDTILSRSRHAAGTREWLRRGSIWSQPARMSAARPASKEVMPACPRRTWYCHLQTVVRRSARPICR